MFTRVQIPQHKGRYVGLCARGVLRGARGDLCFDEVDALKQGNEGLIYGQIVLYILQRAEDAFIESRTVLKQENHP